MWEREGLEVYLRFNGYCDAFFYGREPLFEESTALEEQFLRLSGIGDNRTEALVVFCKIMKNILLGPCELGEGWGPFLLGLANPSREGPRRNWTTEEMEILLSTRHARNPGQKRPHFLGKRDLSSP